MIVFIFVGYLITITFACITGNLLVHIVEFVLQYIENIKITSSFIVRYKSRDTGIFYFYNKKSIRLY